MAEKTASVPNKPATVRDVAADQFIAAYARHLKRGGRVEQPKWVEIVKTAHHNELAPLDPDWFFVRAASLARKIYLDGGKGIGFYQRVYGGRKNNGSRPSHHSDASGSVIRAVLRQLEALKVVEKAPKGGRKITSTGQRDLDRIAGQVFNKRK